MILGFCPAVVLIFNCSYLFGSAKTDSSPKNEALKQESLEGERSSDPWSGMLHANKIMLKQTSERQSTKRVK